MTDTQAADPVLKVLERLLVQHEGVELKPYKCPAGKWTIGVGRNFQDKPLRTDEVRHLFRHGISKEDALWLLHQDMTALKHDFDKRAWFQKLDTNRKAVVLDMVYNLGFAGFEEFTRLKVAIQARDWNSAALEMRDSAWYRQVGNRAKNLIHIMRTGELPDGLDKA